MNKLPIYKAEINDGLKEKILSTASITSASCVEIADPFECETFKTVAENKDQIDLFYLKSILVSTGWNKNDDVFDRAEVWVARSTPEDKPFNYEHDQKQIIGHITSCTPIDVDGTLIADDISVDELPSKFHITTSAVLYKFWEDPAKQEMMNKITEEIAQGKWFVSMEALFSNFDYAVVGGEQSRVVARNEDTAFLTKHLRAYGGSGVYNNLKIGRLLRNITFSGKGLVRKPANPESVIFKEAEAFKSNSVYALGEIVQSKEINAMNEQETEISEMKKQIETMSASLVEANSKIEELSTKSSMHDKETEDCANKLAEASKMAEDFKKSYDAAISELNEMKKEKKAGARLAMAMEKTGMSKDEATLVVASLETLEDEAFANVITMQGEFIKKKAEELKAASSEVEAKKEVASVVEENIEEDPAEAKASTSALDTAEVKLDAALATSEGNSDVDQVASQIASYFGLEKSATE